MVMKKRRILLPALLALLLTVSCGKAEEDSMPFVTAVKIEESEMEEGQSRKDFSENSAERNASGEAASQQSLSEKIAMEISNAEEREKEVEKKQEEAATQPERCTSCGTIP